MQTLIIVIASFHLLPDADGAMVNRGEKDDVISILQRHLPWVIYVWCVAHRLELALKDALQGTIFDYVDEVLLRLYYLYENLPKKLRQLRDLQRMYIETLNLNRAESDRSEHVVCGLGFILLISSVLLYVTETLL